VLLGGFIGVEVVEGLGAAVGVIVAVTVSGPSRADGPTLELGRTDPAPADDLPAVVTREVLAELPAGT
jgi:hypothetical protein